MDKREETRPDANTNPQETAQPQVLVPDDAGTPEASASGATIQSQQAGASAAPDIAPKAPAEGNLAEGAAARTASATEGALGRTASTDRLAGTSRRESKRSLKNVEIFFPFSVIVGRVYDGPLDLLLDLIRKQDIDIWDIPIARITAQFLGYVEQLKETDVDNAGEFIYTASLLIHIKSRMLLPRSPAESPEESEDPRLELVERLLEHERFKNAAQMLLQKQQIEAATWSKPGMREFLKQEGGATDFGQEIAADVPDLVRIFRDILDRARTRPVLDVQEDAVTVGQMIDFVRRRLMMEDRPVALHRLLANTRSERALICMFLALLELVRLQAILLRQDNNFGEVFVKKQEQFDQVMTERLSQMKDDWT